MESIQKIFGKHTPFIVCFTAALFFAYELMQLHMMNAIAPMVIKDLNLNAANFGLLSSTYLLADVLFLIPAGVLLDRYSVRKVILFAMVFCIIGTFGFALSKTLLQASFFHFISGIGNAFCFLSCMILIARWFVPSKQAFMTGLVITIGMLGGFVAQSPFSALAQMVSWRNALLIDGLIGITIFILMYFFVWDKEKNTSTNALFDKAFFQNIKKCLSSQQNIFCGLFISLMNMPLMIIGAVYGSLFLTQMHNISLIEASFIISMICVGTIIGSPIFGYLGDRGSKKRLMLYTSLLSTLIFCTILFLPISSFYLLTLLFLLLGLFTSSQVLGYPLITEHATSDTTGTSISIAGIFVMGLPMILGPIAGKVIDRFSIMDLATNNRTFTLEGFQYAFLIFPIGFLLSTCLANWIEEKRREKALCE